VGGFLLYPDVDTQEWAAIYGLKIKSRECANCKKIFETTRPVAIKGYRGLQAAPHECGSKYAYSTFAPVNKSETEFWMGVKYGG
jgi:hypothetical protein